MKIEKIKNTLSKNKRLLQERHRIKSIGIFGSYARGNFSKKSDLDILVEFSKPPDIFEFIKTEEFLGDLLGVKVDLVSVKALKPLIKDEILKETVYL